MFVTEWRVDAPIDDVRRVLRDHESWSIWWSDIQHARVSDAAYGQRSAALVWRVPVGYHLSVWLTEREEQERSIMFDATGDLVGWGSVTIFELGCSATTVRIEWYVDLAKQWMKILEPVLRPLFIRSHHIVMKHGETGLNTHLKHSMPAVV